MSLMPRVYKSDDPGAPVLTGQAGSLLALLDAVLVNGYGVGESAKSGLGWTRPYKSGAVNCYRNDPVDGSGGYLRIDDSGIGTGASPRHAWVRGYSAMSNLDSGVNPFPTVAQAATGVLIPKSGDLNATPKAWVVVGNARAFYLLVQPHLSNTGRVPMFFGDLDSATVPDGGECCIAATTMSSWTGSTSSAMGALFAPGGSTGAVHIGYAAGGADAVGSRQINQWNAATAVAGGSGQLPYLPGRRLCFSDMLVGEGSISDRVVRGRLPGMVAPLHPFPFADLQRVDGIEWLPGNEVLAVDFHTQNLANTAGRGQALFLTGAPWA